MHNSKAAKPPEHKKASQPGRRLRRFGDFAGSTTPAIVATLPPMTRPMPGDRYSPVFDPFGRFKECCGRRSP
jgi:hypothetical protein